MPSPTATPTPSVPAKAAPRGVVNKKYAKGLNKAQEILDAAGSLIYRTSIVDGVEITDQGLGDQTNRIINARAFLTSATSGRGTRKTSTKAEAAAKKALARALQGIQTRAYQKFHDTDPARLRDTYFGGTNLFKAEDGLMEQIVTSYLQNAGGDNLAKVDAARLDALRTLKTAWNSARGTQGTTGGAAISSFEQFKVVYAQIEAYRQKIQFAADDDFPYYDPTNHARASPLKSNSKAPIAANNPQTQTQKAPGSFENRALF